MPLYSIISSLDEIESIGDLLKKEIRIKDENLILEDGIDMVDGIWDLSFNLCKGCLCKRYVRQGDENKTIIQPMYLELGMKKWNDINLKEVDHSFIMALKQHIVFSSYHTVLCMLAEIKPPKSTFNRSVKVYCENDKKYYQNYVDHVKSTYNTLRNRYIKLYNGSEYEKLRDLLQLESQFSISSINYRMISLLIDILNSWENCPLIIRDNITYAKYCDFKLKLTSCKSKMLPISLDTYNKQSKLSTTQSPIEANISTEYAEERLFGLNIVDEIIKLAESFEVNSDYKDWMYIANNKENMYFQKNKEVTSSTVIYVDENGHERRTKTQFKHESEEKINLFIDKIVTNVYERVPRTFTRTEKVIADDNTVYYQNVTETVLFGCGRDQSFQESLKIPCEHFDKFISVLCKFVKMPNVFSRKQFMYFAINIYIRYYSYERDVDKWKRQVEEFIEQYSQYTFPMLEYSFFYALWKNLNNGGKDEKETLEYIRDELYSKIKRDYSKDFDFAPITNIITDGASELKNVKASFWNKEYLKNIQEGLNGA